MNSLAHLKLFSLFLTLFSFVGCGGGGSGNGEATQPIAVAGTIDIEAGTRVDADNADALTGRAPLTTIQELPPEFVLAGYVSDTVQPRPYPLLESQTDLFEYFPDADDRYVASLQAGLELTLQSFTTRLGTASDLLLTVEAPDGTTVGQAIAPGNGAAVSVAIESQQVGDYGITVTALGSSPMLYILSSSRAEASNITSYDWSKHEFVENEAIISLSGPGAQKNSLPRTSMTEAGRQIAPGIWKVRRPAGFAALSHVNEADQTLAWIQSLRADPSIRHASPNYRTRAMLTPVDEPFYTSGVLAQQWHYSLINGPVAWQLAPGGGNGVSVAVLDTGLFQDGGQWHPDLASNVIAGFDAVDGDELPADPGNSVGGSVYHGTHVSGTVAAAVNGSGGAGVAFGSRLMPVRVLGEGGTGTLSDLLEGMQWVLGDQNRSSADIVNLSLGGLPCGDPGVAVTLQQLIDEGVGRGILYVAAAGNSATSEPSCPAALENVFSVSAVDGAGVPASYSNFGSTIDLAAPGGDASRDGNGDGRGDLVSSTSAAIVDGQLQPVYRGLQGTSMAAPHFSGVLALMKEANAALDSSAVEGYLRSGALTERPCESGCERTDQLGYGVLDGGKAVQAVLSGNPPELLTSSPAIVNLSSESGLAANDSIDLSPLGNYSVTITDVSASQDWFTASLTSASLPLEIEANQVAQVELVLDPDKLDPGVSSRGNLEITYDSRTEIQARLTVPVIGQRITDQQARDAGRHFVLLVEPEPDPQTGLYVTVGQTVATVSDGQYTFEFVPDDGLAPLFRNEVPPGSYVLVAGTDLDNDGLICHAGEACAEYPVSGLRQEIEVIEGGSITGIRMTTSYSRPALSVGSSDLLPRPNFRGYQLLPEQSGSQSNAKRVLRN